MISPRGALVNEFWRPVLGFEELYSVSSRGHVRRDAPNHGARVGHILQPGIRNGYPFVNLHRHGRATKGYVHTLVAVAFLGQRQFRQEVNHIDGDKLNAQVANLEYVSRSENMRHANRNGLAPVREQRLNAKLNRELAAEIRRLAGVISQRQIARRFGVHRSTVCDVLYGRTWADISEVR